MGTKILKPHRNSTGGSYFITETVGFIVVASDGDNIVALVIVARGCCVIDPAVTFFGTQGGCIVIIFSTPLVFAFSCWSFLL